MTFRGTVIPMTSSVCNFDDLIIADENTGKIYKGANMSDDKTQFELGAVDETVSYRNGFSYEFEDAGNVINVRCSSISGKETVYVNEVLVAEKRSFRRKSTLVFNIDEDSYEIEFNVVDMLKGETHCTLIKNDLHVKTIKKALLKKNQIPGKNSWFIVSLIFLFGLISGYLLMRYLLMVFGG